MYNYDKTPLPMHMGLFGSFVTHKRGRRSEFHVEITETEIYTLKCNIIIIPFTTQPY